MNYKNDLHPLPSAPSPVSSNNQQRQTREYAPNVTMWKNIKIPNGGTPQPNPPKKKQITNIKGTSVPF